MAATLPPGIGTDAEVNQANQFLREQDWDRKFIEQTGQDPNHVQLSDEQRDQLLQLAREHGIGISDHFEIDEAGNIHPKSGIGKKLLIGAAIGGAALTGLGLAGIGPMAGLFGGGEATAVGTGAVTAGETAAAGVLPSTAVGAGMVGPIAGGTGISSAGVLGGAGGVLSGLGTVAKGLTTADKVANALRMGGQAIGGAEKEAADSRTRQAQLALEANRENIEGTNAVERALMQRAQLEMAQRQQEQRNMARASYMQHPFQSPYAPSTGSRFSSQYMQSMGDLSNQAAADLSQSPVYGTRSLPARPSYTPINIKDIPEATGTEPGFWSKFGNIAGPGLSLIGAFMNRSNTGGY